MTVDISTKKLILDLGNVFERKALEEVIYTVRAYEYDTGFRADLAVLLADELDKAIKEVEED